MRKREIPRNPKAPELNEETRKLLTELCFQKDDPPQEADILFVFSQPVFTDRIGETVEDILERGLVKKVFVTGGIPRYTDIAIVPKPESELILGNIPRERFPDVRFYSEDRSQNTLENVTEALRVLDFRDFESVLFVFWAHSAGRGYLTLRKFLPKARILQKSIPVPLEGLREIHRVNWHTFPFGRERIWGEFLRIKAYGERGDIAFAEARDTVERIAALTDLEPF